MLLARNVLLDDRRLDRYTPGVRTAPAVLQLGPGGYHPEISCLVGLGWEARPSWPLLQWSLPALAHAGLDCFISSHNAQEEVEGEPFG